MRGEPCAGSEFNVTFTPNQSGPRSASIAITDDSAGSPQSVSLDGVGVTSGPSATLSAMSLNFGSQGVNTTSPAQSITLSNYGNAALNITGITASANFAETDNCVTSLASVASCTINVTFTPSAIGSYNGTLSIVDNAKGSPQTETLNGTGVAQPPPGCTPIGDICGSGLPKCCAAPFPHHSFYSSRTGWGRCLMN